MVINAEDVKESGETKSYLIYKTPTHMYKVNDEKLEDLIPNTSKLQTEIQKKMKQIVDYSTPEWWEESWKAIFEKITGQKLVSEKEYQEKKEEQERSDEQ